MTTESICVGLVAVVAGIICVLGGTLNIPILKDVQPGKRFGLVPADNGVASPSTIRWRMIVLGAVFLLLGLSFVLGLRFPWQ